MSRLAAIQAAAAIAASTGPDMNEAQKGGSGARLLPTGYALGRLVEYVEFGNQPQEYNGKAKDPALEAQLGFALWGAAVDAQGQPCTYHNDDGTPYILRLFPMALSRNDKARAFLMFKAMNWKNTAKHFAELIGQPILVKIVHEEKSKADKTIVSRIDPKGFLPPLDPVTRQPYAIPEAPDDAYRLFLWDYPTLEDWNSLYVEGTFDDGKSKNRLQETILAATNFAGSALETLLIGNGLAKPAPALPAAPIVPGNTGVPAAPFVPSVAPAVAPVTTSPVAVPSAPVATMAPTSPSSPVVPVLPSIPALPVAPVIPQ